LIFKELVIIILILIVISDDARRSWALFVGFDNFYVGLVSLGCGAWPLWFGLSLSWSRFYWNLDVLRRKKYLVFWVPRRVSFA